MILGYIRVSDRSQKDNTSPAEQRRVIQAVALGRNIRGFDVAFFEDTASGSVKLSERPEGKKLLAAAKKGDIIVAAKLDRIFRDVIDALEIFQHCKQNGIDLVLYDLGMESVVRDGISKLLFTIITAFAEMERSRIRERVLSGKRVKKERGGHVGGVAPYGFRIEGSGPASRLVSNRDEQETVELVKHLARQGPPAWVCRRLTDLGVKTRVGTEFTTVQVDRIAARKA